MNDDVRMPIQTIREGNKITKICVEDVYKIINRVQDAMDKAYNNSIDILDFIYKEIPIESEEDMVWEGYLIEGKGTSQPCLTDAFDEEIGNNIAFMKSKLNANIKKHNFLCRIYNQYFDLLNKISEEIIKVDSNIIYDLDGVRKHNPEYLKGIETKLGIC